MQVVNPISDMVSMMRSKGLLAARKTFLDGNYKVSLHIESLNKCINTMFRVGSIIKFIDKSNNETSFGFVKGFNYCESTSDLKSVLVEWKHVGSGDITEFPIEYAFNDLEVVQ